MPGLLSRFWPPENEHVQTLIFCFGLNEMKRHLLCVCFVLILATDSFAGFRPFGVAKVTPVFMLNGAGKNIDSVAFWESPNRANTLLFVTGKANNVIEVWKYPFINNELTPLILSEGPNGVDVDQDRDWLLIGDARERALLVFSIPRLTPSMTTAVVKPRTSMCQNSGSTGLATYWWK